MNKKALIRKFQTICSKIGMSKEDRQYLYAGMGIESVTDLKAAEISQLINQLQAGSKENTELDKLRNRVLAVMFAYFGEVHINFIKSVACKASACASFNAIPKQKLIALYSTWNNKNKIKQNAEKADRELEQALRISPQGEA